MYDSSYIWIFSNVEINFFLCFFKTKKRISILLLFTFFFFHASWWSETFTTSRKDNLQKNIQLGSFNVSSFSLLKPSNDCFSSSWVVFLFVHHHGFYFHHSNILDVVLEKIENIVPFHFFDDHLFQTIEIRCYMLLFFRFFFDLDFYFIINIDISYKNRIDFHQRCLLWINRVIQNQMDLFIQSIDDIGCFFFLYIIHIESIYFRVCFKYKYNFFFIMTIIVVAIQLFSFFIYQK